MGKRLTASSAGKSKSRNASKTSAAVIKKPRSRRAAQKKRIEELNIPAMAFGLAGVVLVCGLTSTERRSQNLLVGASLLVMAASVGLVAVKAWKSRF